MPSINEILTTASDLLFSWVLVVLLVAGGLFLTVRTRAVQVRHAAGILSAVRGSRSGAHGGITSFQAFAVGLASRVGTGNIVGVALALIMGGPGAVLWMWVVAVLGTATAFSESTLAQIFKVRRADGTYRGGPAHYIARGMGLPALGAVFAVVFMIANGLAMPMLQANAIASSLASATPITPQVGALIIVALTAPVLLGGLRSIARTAELLAPVMALAYLVLVVVILLTHPVQAWQALESIWGSALGLRQGLAGVAGGAFAALLNGVRRGLFSNEAGLGGAACAAGSATVAHPVQQGFIQAFGVLVDTLLICTATALAILVAGPAVYAPGVTTAEAANTLTQDAIAHLVGQWSRGPMVILIVVLAYTTIIGAFSYAQICLDYLTDRPWAARLLQVSAVACAAVGSLQAMTTVWALADVMLGLGAILNLVAILVLSRWVVGALRDWEAQTRHLRAGEDGSAQGAGARGAGDRVGTGGPAFHADSPHLPAELSTAAWPRRPRH
ncbi:alanine:cation symporter family protein [Actinomyces bowdenii]|uniref:alanine/glycine:cation symporter family protein n=1 Tax=Actinomyces bowdenii TaxID=131109 RepID=UPI00214CFD33|nr:alanine/glycine:cation symporter family protein [Actinomyces bowdenii]MCR2052078.1 alanine:cation symporter family protein [Actinomyces bowdenii]